MMDLGPVSTRNSGAQAQSGSQADAAADKLSSDFETFLRLLTTQISSQDPLDPMKPEQFASQLATFSTVEQSVRTNDLLERILAGQGAGGSGDLAGWIGREARAPMATRFDGAPVTLHPAPAASGQRHALVVLDASGSEIDRRAIDGSGDPVTWDGRLRTGGRAPDGIYRFVTESYEGESLTASATAETYARVSEVRFAPDGARLLFAGGVEIGIEDATALRALE